MKYCFEMYEFSDRGRVFLGYKSINAENADLAKELASNKLKEGIKLEQIYIPQEDV